MRLKCISINVRGLRAPSKRSLVVRKLAHLNYDIVFMQETHVSCKQHADEFERLWHGKCYWAFGANNSAGVAVLFSPSFSGQIIRFVFDSDGRVLSLLIKFGSLNFNLVNIYAPNNLSERKVFFERLHDYFISQGDLILGGDFNCVDNALDKFHSNEVPSSDKNCLCSLKSDFSLVDVWRKQNPRGVSLTWSNSNHTQASRIDCFFISKSPFQSIRSNKVLPCVFSDHDFITLELNPDGSSDRRSNIWKFNCSLLSDLEKQKLDVEINVQGKIVSTL